MNIEQQHEIIDLINKDCAISMRYAIEGTNDTCAIGCLAKAAEVPLVVLVGAGTQFISTFGGNGVTNAEIDCLSGMRLAIGKKFGLTVEQMRRIQMINDNYDTPEARRLHIIEWLKGEPISVE